LKRNRDAQTPEKSPGKYKKKASSTVENDGVYHYHPINILPSDKWDTLPAGIQNAYYECFT
jgi:hypothetical protein